MWARREYVFGTNVVNPLSPATHHSKIGYVGMVVAHEICMGTCPVTQVSFQQSYELSGAVSKSFQTHILYGLTAKNTIFGLLRPLYSLKY
jgi:hypothetical protein